MDRAARAVDQWRREWPDLDVGPMLVFGRLAEAAARVRARLDAVFARHGLQGGEFDVLATLRRAGAPHALTPTALSAATMVTSGAMTARLDRLERAGLVVRRPNPADRRGSLVALTERGRGLVDAALVDHVANEHALVAGLDPGERADLARLLARLVETLPADEP